MLNLKISNLQFNSAVFSNRQEMIDIFDQTLERKSKGYFVALNPEKIVNTSKKDEWKKIWSGALGIYADGVGIVHAAKILENKKIERIFPLGMILERLNQRKGKLFLFGSKENIVMQAKKEIESAYNHIQITDVVPGYNFDSKEVVGKINSSKPDVILVALGSPKQEEWIHQNIADVHQGIFLGVGGALDIWAGKRRRAPILFQKIGLEWLYRLITQPTRVRRQLKLLIFIRKVLGEKLSLLLKIQS